MGEEITALAARSTNSCNTVKFRFSYTFKIDVSGVIAMSKTTIQNFGVRGSTLIVFHTEAHCWQFRLISSGGTVFWQKKLYSP